MPMTGPGLADEIRTEMGFPAPTSQQLIGWATGVVTHIQTAGIATFGNIPGPHPITGLSGPVMAATIAPIAGYPGTTPELINYCTGIATYIMANGVVTYTGPAPMPPTILPPAAWFLGGTISGMDGNAMSVVVAGLLGLGPPTPPLINKCTAIANHIQTNAQVVSGVIS